MTLTELVPSREVCQRLKAAGFPQDTALAWYPEYCDDYEAPAPASLWPDEWKRIAAGIPVVCVREEMEDHESLCAAPTAEEILKELPETYDSDYYLSAVLRKGYAHVGWYDWDDEYLGHVDEGEGQSLVQAAALAYLWWKEQK
jgi:hypothetical protein